MLMVTDSYSGQVEQGLLERYLLNAGWQRETFPNRVRRIFLAGKEDEVELFFTGNKRYIRRETELALDTLSQLYGKSADAIISDIRGLVYDVIRSRVPTEYVKNESIELRMASTYIKKMKDFLASAATTEITGAKSYKRVLKDGVSYSERCLFGHTFHGSFGFVIESPVGLNNEPSLDGIIEELPFERRVVERIALGFSSYSVAISEQSYEPITGSVNGFSANMCDILADMVEEMEVSRLDMGMKFSPEWKSAPDVPASGFSIEHRNLDLLRAASKSMREEQLPRRVTVFGRIKRLETDGNPADLLEDNATREIEINWIDEDDQLLYVKCAVTPADYLTAVEAHKEGKVVFATGMLAKSGRSWRLSDVSDFKVHE